MRLSSLRTAASVAAEHGQGLIVLINGTELALTELRVVDTPRELALCDGQTEDGSLVLFDPESVDAVRLPTGEDGQRARLPSVGRR
ncbi:MAG: hypothetical protein AAF533_29180 [Acidobacteriota bacterium]